MEKMDVIDNFDTELERVRKFQELFNLLNFHKITGEYTRAYDEAVEIAKSLIETKSKPSWEPEVFLLSFKEKYKSLSEVYISTLRRCIENYNPPVNIPNTSLWD